MGLKDALQANWRFLTDFDHTHKKSFVEKMFIVLGVLVVDLIYVGLMIQLLQFIFSSATIQKYSFWKWFDVSNINYSIQESIVSSLVTAILFAVILAPLWETFVFHFTPTYLALRTSDKERILYAETSEKFGKFVWIIVIVSNIIFGLGHGGPINLLIQGVGGLFMSYVYFRNGRSFWSIVFLHALYNGVIIFFVYTGAWSSIAAGITLPFWVLI